MSKGLKYYVRWFVDDGLLYMLESRDSAPFDTGSRN